MPIMTPRAARRAHTRARRGIVAAAAPCAVALALVAQGPAEARPPQVEPAIQQGSRALETAGPVQASGNETAIAAAVAAAPRTEEGGFDLYRRGLYPEAMMVWEEAAEAGDAGAAYRVGAALMDGQAVPMDLVGAHAWLNRAAEMGEPRAMGDLGAAYDWGVGVERDHDAAARWYLLAAERGHAASQYNIAVLYEEGASVDRDIERAYMFYVLADRNGFPKYPAEAIERLTPELSNAQLKRAMDGARAFVPISGPPL